MISEEKSELNSGNIIDEALNIKEKIPRIHINENLDLYFDPKMNYISFSPIIPVVKIDILFKLFNLKITKEEIINKVRAIVAKNKLKLKKNKKKISDEKFIKDSIILSKTNIDGPFVIADKISKKIFGELITYKYNTNEKGKKYTLAYLKLKNNIFLKSNEFNTNNEAKLDVAKKIINKYFI